ncbi:hypothetical protein [Arthrobacter sp. NicSoilB8]|uniref:hypothetical protein n=1 Tax=Arthrobacter sp. NicSoilB8 TaxID=2830998 RepID=UPI001CC61F8F|nr:hypothetical protein [Arthrobacter sp. NicSoilB8]BCW71871.1 hypothetical protein NicSoilB8_29150 [Arthrobacter sp. NicSoilB8]
MGHWETEHGDIILSSAEFAAVCQAAQKATHDHQATVFEETQSFWKGLTRKEQTDPEAYRAAKTRHIAERRRLTESALRSWGHRSVTPHAEEIISDVDWRLSHPRGAKPARVLKSDLPFPTNRTTEFQAGEGSVTFDKERNTVRWETGQYRDVIEKARSSVAGEALFNRIKTVKWTRGTGGVFRGDNEISNEEADGANTSPRPTDPSAPPRSRPTARSTPTRKATASPAGSSPTSSRNSGGHSGR